MAAPLLFTPFFATTNIIHVFLQCDAVGQVITVGLGVFSIIAWSIMIGKHYELKRLRDNNHAFERRLNYVRRLLDLPESFR